jgi:Uma2 family endonuclease
VTPAPSYLTVLPAPFDVVLADDTVLQPDLLVARRSDFTAHDLPSAPLLVVEVLSPSTRLIDLNLERALYQASGVSSYWVIEPDGPALTAWELRGDEYVEVAQAVGEDEYATVTPYSLVIVPARLVD